MKEDFYDKLDFPLIITNHSDLDQLESLILQEKASFLNTRQDYLRGFNYNYQYELCMENGSNVNRIKDWEELNEWQKENPLNATQIQERSLDFINKNKDLGFKFHNGVLDYTILFIFRKINCDDRWFLFKRIILKDSEHF